jgi:hypothetical protein
MTKRALLGEFEHLVLATDPPLVAVHKICY